MIIRRDGSRLLVAAALAVVANLGLLGLAALLVHDEAQRVFPSVQVPVNILRTIETVETEPLPERPPEPPPEKPAEVFTPDFGIPSLLPSPPGVPVMSINIGNLDIDAGGGDFIFQAGELDQPPQVVSRVPPIYPFRARQRGVEGFVRVRFLVAPDGSISRISIIDAQPAGIFEDSVLQILPRWRISPGVIDGESVNSWMATTILFELTS